MMRPFLMRNANFVLVPTNLNNPQSNNELQTVLSDQRDPEGTDPSYLSSRILKVPLGALFTRMISGTIM